jgi:hypothetical protein
LEVRTGKIEPRHCNLITPVRLRDEVQQSDARSLAGPNLEGHVKPEPMPLAA